MERDSSKGSSIASVLAGIFTDGTAMGLNLMKFGFRFQSGRDL